MTACKRCPFRVGSPEPYTPEGLECLDVGREPACHEKAARGAQFDDPMPNDGIICQGYLAFMDGAGGRDRFYE